jgi:hypothetical protein
MRKLVNITAIGLVGLALGVGGTLGVQAVTDEDMSKPSVQTSPTPSFRSEVRKQLAEEWGDAYARCLRDDEYWGADVPGHEYPGYPRVDDHMRQTCRDMANEILP